MGSVIENIKAGIEYRYADCDLIDSKVGVGPVPLRDLLKDDLLNYFLYLLKAKGLVSDEDAYLIDFFMGVNKTPMQWTYYIADNNDALDAFGKRVPESFPPFVFAKNTISLPFPYRDMATICDNYVSGYDAAGINFVGKSASGQAALYSFRNMLLAYIVSDPQKVRKVINAVPRHEIRLGIQNESAEYIKCPKCGKYTTSHGVRCSSCFHDFDEMVFSDANYVTPILIETFYSDRSKDDSIQLIYFTRTTGLAINTYTSSASGMTKQEKFEKPFVYKEGHIILGDGNSATTYNRFGDFLYDPEEMFKGQISNGKAFEAYCTLGEVMGPRWFLPDGTIIIYDNIRATEVKARGRYVRDKNIVRAEIQGIKSGKSYTSYYLVVNGHLYNSFYIYDKAWDKAHEIDRIPFENVGTDSDYSITQKEFLDNYPCPCCNARRAFTNVDWKYTAFGHISVSGNCKKCGYGFSEVDEPERMRRIAYDGSADILKKPAGAVRYLDNPCPYCGAYEVRYAKWSDKHFSVAFWGRFSYKLHMHYICTACGKMWE